MLFEKLAGPLPPPPVRRLGERVQALLPGGADGRREWLLPLRLWGRRFARRSASDPVVRVRDQSQSGSLLR